ncbi:MAG TPA: hypothetical protein VJ742_12240 [Nitrososphaera sp.]|nr:hypothetical protein [Nitrososphaera sp.]
MKFNLPDYDIPNKSHHLRAKGNLSYLEFIRQLESVWSDGHPDVPFFAMTGQQYAKYPCIVYHLQLRKTHPSEPKARYREEIFSDDPKTIYIVAGQRFQNVINFTAISENPLEAEELIESFEDFMFEFTPVFKELGVSELIYARRLPDAEENRSGQDVCKRTVAYLVTTEKVIQTTMDRWEKILIRARQSTGPSVEDATPSIPDATPTVIIEDNFMTDSD